MDSRFTYFLLVAEELNMRKAAEKAFITPQGISTAIKSLEAEYKIPLFIRTPKLRLTSQGEMLLDAVRQIKVIEDNLSTVISGKNYDFRGKIYLGILESRYEIVTPDIVSSFISLYKNVELEVSSAYSYNLEQQIENNKLDMVITPGIIKSPNLETLHVIDEDFVILISHSMLLRYFPGIAAEDIDRFRKGVQLKDFSHVPMIRYPSYTRFFHVIANYEEKNNFQFQSAFVSNHALSFSRFVQRDVGFAIVSNLFLPRIAEQNLGAGPQEYIYAFPILNLPYCNNLRLAYRRDRRLANCHYDLIDIILRTFSHYAEISPHCL